MSKYRCKKTHLPTFTNDRFIKIFTNASKLMSKNYNKLMAYNQLTNKLKNLEIGQALNNKSIEDKQFLIDNYNRLIEYINSYLYKYNPKGDLLSIDNNSDLYDYYREIDTKFFDIVENNNKYKKNNEMYKEIVILLNKHRFIIDSLKLRYLLSDVFKMNKELKELNEQAKEFFIKYPIKKNYYNNAHNNLKIKTEKYVNNKLHKPIKTNALNQLKILHNNPNTEEITKQLIVSIKKKIEGGGSTNKEKKVKK